MEPINTNSSSTSLSSSNSNVKRIQLLNPVIIGFIILVVILASLLIYAVLNNKKSTSNTNTLNVSSNVVTTTTDLTQPTPVVIPDAIKPDEKELATYNQKYKDWNSYVSKMYDFSLKYPNSWKLDVSSMDLSCRMDQYLKNNESCAGKKADVITLTKGNKGSTKFMSITFLPFVLNKGCESCRLKSYPLSMLNRGGYSADFTIMDGEVTSLSYLSYSYSTINSDKLTGIVPGKNSKFISLPAQLFYGKDVIDVELEEELKILESIL